jgi:2,4-dienoyl-CoA reductase (NADPH2)
MIERTGVELVLERRVAAADLQGYDHVVLATGIVPRVPRFPASITRRSPATPTS